MSLPTIAVPYFPGSNGDHDAIGMIARYGMKPLPLYFHIGDGARIERCAKILREDVDGAVLPGGFPYEDRLGFGVVPARIRPFVEAMYGLVEQGKPVIAFCSGNQIAHEMRLAFPRDSSYKVQLLPNICDRDGKLVAAKFLDGEPYTVVDADSERTAFTKHWTKGDVVQTVMDHGGGRFWTDRKTLEYILQHGLVVSRYSDKLGTVIDNYPTNPNGSMLNIESITNLRGNLKIGMLHNERWRNALYAEKAHLVFESMRQYIAAGCPDLSAHAMQHDIPIKLKDYGYMSKQLDPQRTVDIYVRMLIDDNEHNTAQIFLGRQHDKIDRRRLIRIECSDGVTKKKMEDILRHIADMNILDGILLKKDVPTVTGQGMPVETYEVVEKTADTLRRDFVEHGVLVPKLPVRLEQVGLPNPGGYILRQKLWRDPMLRQAITHVQTGQVWFFPDESEKDYAEKHLFN